LFLMCLRWGIGNQATLSANTRNQLGTTAQ
jgi:hypothetical protein